MTDHRPEVSEIGFPATRRFHLQRTKLKRLILQAFNATIRHSTNLHYEENLHFAISLL